ncbi:taste receptor type 2 member 40-like [Lithobates pipiens]
MDTVNVFSSVPLTATVLTIVAVELIASFLENGFIVAVNFFDWLKKKHLNPVDHLLVVLALSNAGFSYIFGNVVFFFLTWPELFLEVYAVSVVMALLFLMTFSSSWLTAWLCLYFCFKIIQFKSSFLTKVKMSIDSAVVWLILISEAIAFSCSIPMIWSYHRPLPQTVTVGQNASQIESFTTDTLYIILVIGANISSASLIIITSLVYVIWSLCRHTYRMKKRISPEDDSMLKKHRSAVKTILSLLLIYVLFFTFLIMNTTSQPSDGFFLYYWCLIAWMLLSFPPAFSAVLIFGNSKLRLALQKICSLIISSICKDLTQG